ncbi:MAG: NAD(P)-dependent oxidoreductase, partial [Thaumarchaeota archaeon]|nr:NAD(P)-dependent oxidoreductase [Nitrososphaerota archaeon]
KSVEELVALGAKAASTPGEVAKASDVVIDMVTDAPDVEQVLLGENGVITGGKKGLVAIDMSTNSPEIARMISKRLGEREIAFLDAPVTGGDKGAREATLTIMVGGNQETFERCKPIFEALGKEIVYMGPSGAGQAMKLCNQTAVAIHMLATCESLLLGSSAGLDITNVLRVLTSGAANSWNLTNLGPKVAKHDFEPGFKAAHLLKDLRYVMQLSEANHLSLPGSSIVYQLYNSIMAEGDGERGTQILVRVLEKLASREVR